MLPLRIATCEEMLLGPVGRYAHGECFLIWCTTPELCGLVVWGRLTLAELELLTRVFDRGETSGISLPCDFVLDSRRLEAIEPGAFDFLIREAATRIGMLHRRLRRQAFLRGGGVLGAALAGFYPVLDADLVSKIFTDQSSALAWLGERDPRVSSELDRLVADVVAGSTVVDRLRTYLASRFGTRPAIDEAARWLGVSSRSLQRQLHDAKTSFRTELDHARQRLAEQLLVETDLKIAAIAERVGASTEASFIAFFRRRTNQSPAAWRRSASALASSSGRRPDRAPRT
ncbi:MAG: AraC family transcriptional regulator [Kofleriaceae bacterium]